MMSEVRQLIVGWKLDAEKLRNQRNWLHDHNFKLEAMSFDALYQKVDFMIRDLEMAIDDDEYAENEPTSAQRKG